MPSPRPITPAQREALDATRPDLPDILKAIIPNHTIRRKPTTMQAMQLFKMWLTCFKAHNDYQCINVDITEDTPTAITVRVTPATPGKPNP